MFNPARGCLPLLRRLAAARARLPACPRARPLRRPNHSSVRSLSANPTPPEENPAGGPMYIHNGREALEALSHARNGLVVQRELYHMGTITVKRPGDTDIHTIIDQIEPLPFLSPKNQTPTAMLLITPSFASALQPSEPEDPASLRNAPEVVTQAVSRLIQDSLERETTARSIRVIAAVVDRLPSPEGGSQASKGREGLAYALWLNDNVARHSWSMDDTKVRREDDAACLTFDIFDRFKLTDLQGWPRRPYGDTVHRLHLPLANTLFQTGQTSLLYNIHYRLSEIVEPKRGEGAILQNRRTLHVTDVKKVKSQRVTWPVAGRYLAHFAKNHPNWEKTLHQLHVPLVPLTGPRLVEAGMGNIIRQISGPDGKTAPASHELENAVSSFFEATGQAPHAMPVWALVCSERTVKYFSAAALAALGKWQPQRFSNKYDYAGLLCHHISEAWNADHKIFQPAIWKAMLVGNARLHRVLSGGGGWGKKAGLISLDPTKSAQWTAQQTATLGEMGPATEESLKAVAEPGSYITFFTSPVASLDVPKYDHDTSVFGTLPSSIDDIPDTTIEGPSGIDVWPGYFGALSEQGMSFKFIRRDPGKPENWSQTMVDVPFSLFVTSSRLPAAIPAPAVENVEVATSKPACSPNDTMNPSSPGPFATTTRRSLHTRAKSAFGIHSVRSFSFTPLSRFPKTKHYIRHRPGSLRPLVPISARFREIDLSRLEVPEDTAADFRMTLNKYPRFWKFSRWLAEYSQAQLDLRPERLVPGRKRDRPFLLARELWQRRVDASKAHMVRLREGHMQMLQLQVKALVQHIDRIITSQLQQLPRIGPKIKKSIAIRVSNGKGSLKNTLSCIRAEERAVAPLPFRAPEVTKFFEDSGHKVAVKCKKYEDSVYPIVLRFRKRMRARRKLMETQERRIVPRPDPKPFGFMPQRRQTINIQRTAAPDSDVRWDLLGPVEGDIKSMRSSLRPKSRPTISRAPTSWQRPHDQFSVTNQHRRRLSYSHRLTAPDSPSSSSPPLSSAEEANEDNTLDSLSSAFSLYLEETNLYHTPDSPSSYAPPRAEQANVDDMTSDAFQLLFHQNQFRDTRKYFYRKRRVGLKELREMANNVAKVRRYEVAYLTEAVELTDLVCIDLLLQCAAFNRDAWARRVKRLADRAGPSVSQKRHMWWAMWCTDNIDDATVQEKIRKQRWRILRWSRKAKIGDEVVHKRFQYVLNMLQETDKGTNTLRMLNERLEEIIEERLKHETRGYERKKIQKAYQKLRTAEIVRLREAIDASERTLEVMDKVLFLIERGGSEELERQRRIMENVRQKMDDATVEKVNVAWSLANELEQLLGR